jgi:hypothetical protein
MFTAVTAIDAGTLRLGHQVVDSTTSKTDLARETRALPQRCPPQRGRSSPRSAKRGQGRGA